MTPHSNSGIRGCTTSPKSSKYGLKDELIHQSYLVIALSSKNMTANDKIKIPRKNPKTEPSNRSIPVRLVALTILDILIAKKLNKNMNTTSKPINAATPRTVEESIQETKNFDKGSDNTFAAKNASTHATKESISLVKPRIRP